MRIDILTLFPDSMNAMLHESILGRAAKKGILELNCIQIRDYTENKQKQVDDYPYGGGWGCVINAQPLKSCVDSVMSTAQGRKSRIIYMSPQGRPFTQAVAREYAERYDHLVLVCGHYEGVDERFIEQCVDEELSLGDFVLTGGELAAMAVTDAVCRLVPGVLSDPECYTGESHWAGLLEYPQYTRPEIWEGRAVPEVLRSGNEAEIAKWRRKQSLLRTKRKRPDLFAAFQPDETDRKLLEELERDARRMVLTEPVACRPATEPDIGDILLILRQARNYMKKHRLDQWQGEYPAEADIRRDLEQEIGYVITYGERVAGYFALTAENQACYDVLTDGKWSAEAPYFSLHRAAVKAEFRGSDLSSLLIDAAENLARVRGIPYLRTDTHRHNEAMKALLRRHGYTFRGNVLVEECGHDPRRQGFDKLLK